MGLAGEQSGPPVIPGAANGPKCAVAVVVQLPFFWLMPWGLEGSLADLVTPPWAGALDYLDDRAVSVTWHAVRILPS